MNRFCKLTVVIAYLLALGFPFGDAARGNGGPFVLKYPNGDPAAKGVLARLDPDLRPAREERLRVVKEDLNVTFGADPFSKSAGEAPPLTSVSAEYTIENPTDEAVTVDFGFPILRGMYISPLAMMPRPDVRVEFDGKGIKSTVISNSAIYGLIRRRARAVIDKAVNADPELSKRVASVQGADRADRVASRDALASYLVDSLNWNHRDAALMVEYASLDFDKIRCHPLDRGMLGWWGSEKELNELPNQNLGLLSAIGEQKATQFFAQLASRFEADVAVTYEGIFAAWGGDVRERSVDLTTGKVRPRELTVGAESLTSPAHFRYTMTDPTIYARVDYLDPRATISEEEKASCRRVLKNLPVVFTFAPMNLLHYQVTFPAGSTKALTVSYSQYAYKDTRSPASYQLAYVVHPASLWDHFGPINLEVAAPEGVHFQASVPCTNDDAQQRKPSRFNTAQTSYSIYRSILHDKTGEIYLAVRAQQWQAFYDRHVSPPTVAQRRAVFTGSGG